MSRFLHITLLLFLSFLLEAYGQSSTQKIDSIQKTLSSISSDTARLNRCIAISKERQSDDYAVAIHFAEQAVALARKTKLPEREAYAINILGNIYWYMSDNDKAMKFYLEAMAIRDRIKDKRGMGTSRINIGSLLSEQGDFVRSRKYFNEALSLFREIGNIEEETAVMINVAEWHYYQKNYDSAMVYYQQAKTLAKEHHFLDQYSQANNGMASLLRRNDQADEAIKLYLENIQLDIEAGDEYSQTVALNNLSLSYASKGDFKKAIETAMQSLELSLKIDNKTSISFALGNLTSYYEAIGDYKNAYKYQNSYLAYREELNSEENVRITREMEAKFQDEQKELAIAKLKETEKFQQEEIKRKELEAKNERNKKLVFASGFILVLALAFVIFRSLQQNRKATKIISAQKADVEEKKHLLEEKNKEILDSITYAKRLQDAILPPVRIVKEYLPQSFVLYLPKDIVAGDFYFLEAVKGKTIFAAADCTGHGVPGALVSVVCSNALNRAVNEFGLHDPGKILDKVRELVVDTFSKSENEVKDGMDISLCCLDHEQQTLHWAGANNPLWIIRNDADTIEEITADKQPVGAGMQAQPFTSHRIKLQTGDRFYLFSDGFADQFGGENGKKFKSSNFKKLLLAVKDQDMALQRKSILDQFMQWKGEIEQLDDVCVIGVRI